MEARAKDVQFGLSERPLDGKDEAVRPISDNTLNAALRRFGYPKEEVTAQRFRASESGLLNEFGGRWHSDAIERRVECNDVRAAYAPREYWNERIAMMQWWADHLDHLEGDGVNQEDVASDRYR